MGQRIITSKNQRRNCLNLLESLAQEFLLVAHIQVYFPAYLLVEIYDDQDAKIL